MKKNERGFSLVIVLFAIVLFSVIGLSLFTVTNSNAKQINKTYEQLVAIDLAEMGITYFETVFTADLYHDLDKKIDSEITILTQNNREITVQNIKSGLISTSLSKIGNLIRENNNILTTNINGNFKFHQIRPYTTANDIFVTFESEGIDSNGQSITLKGRIEIDIHDYIDKYLNGRQTSGTIKDNSNVEEILLSKCLTANPPTSCKTEVTSTIPANNGNTPYNNKTIYATDSSEANNLSFSKSNIFVDGSYSMNNITNASSNTFLFVNGDLTSKNINPSGGNPGINGSQIYVIGAFTTSSIKKEITNSKICAKEFVSSHNNAKQNPWTEYLNGSKPNVTVSKINIIPPGNSQYVELTCINTGYPEDTTSPGLTIDNLDSTLDVTY